MELNVDVDFDDMKADYSIKYLTSLQAGFNNMKADRTRVLMMVLMIWKLI